MTEPKNGKPASYKDAGVDVDEGARAVEAIKESVRSTYRPEVIGDLGGFGGLFDASFPSVPHPVLVSGSDGVGTKTQVARLLDRYDTIGIDLVAMCANDVLVSGAEPVFFLDYISMGKVDAEKVGTIVGGVAEGCRTAGCALIGGETAEHPGLMDPDDYDLSGVCVGVVSRHRMIDGHTLDPGDVILGLSSSGLHSNGYSLVRKVLVEGNEDEMTTRRLDLGGFTLGEALLAPTRIYARPILSILAEGIRIKGMAHVTGGGITENLGRVLPRGQSAYVDRRAWRTPPIFRLIQFEGGISDDEMYRTFNMGIGFAVILSPLEAAEGAAALRRLGETVFEIGELVEGTGGVVYE